MARAKSTDFLHNFRFHVTVDSLGGHDLKSQPGAGNIVGAGFNTCSTPEATQEAVEYREGHFIYTQKYSGLPSISDVSLSRGVALSDGTFWGWMKDIIESGSEYRADVTIKHFHRDAKPDSATASASPMPVPAAGYLEYRCTNAFPTRHKVSSDLDATGSEVSIQELDLAVESFDVVQINAV